MADGRTTAALDPVVRLYRGVVALGVAGLLLLGLGLGEFFVFEPPGQHSGLSARIEGVYAYDAASKQAGGGDRAVFKRDQAFAAAVDWSALPEGQSFGARWFDSFQTPAGGVGPAHPSGLARLVPVQKPPGLHYNLPGHYYFVVERFSGGQPVEVIASRSVLVELST